MIAVRVGDHVVEDRRPGSRGRHTERSSPGMATWRAPVRSGDRLSTASTWSSRLRSCPSPCAGKPRSATTSRRRVTLPVPVRGEPGFASALAATHPALSSLPGRLCCRGGSQCVRLRENSGRPWAIVSLPWRPGSFRRTFLVFPVARRPTFVAALSATMAFLRSQTLIPGFSMAPGSSLLYCSVGVSVASVVSLILRPPRSAVLPAVLPAESAPAGSFLPKSAQVCTVDRPMNPVFIGFFADPGRGFIPGVHEHRRIGETYR